MSMKLRASRRSPCRSSGRPSAGRDREDKPGLSAHFRCPCFSNRVNRLEYYHNSSWLEHGGAPERAVKNAFVYAIDAYCKQTNKYTKSNQKITFQDVMKYLECW